MNLEAVEDRFWENFRTHGELGASVSIWKHGREILSLAGGFADRQKERPWDATTPVLVWSATKGVAAACVLHALERNGVKLETPVSAFWPEFGAAGKERITFAQVLSHGAGLAVLDAVVPVFDHGVVAEALAAQEPNWVPGDGHGYHPRTFGALLDELVRRVDGIPLADYWRTYFAVPLGLDFWIGIPAERLNSVASIYPAKTAKTSDGNEPKPDADFYAALANPQSFTARAFRSPKGLDSVAAMNTVEARTASLPAFGGIGTAQALAKFYAMLANGGTLGGLRVFESTDPMTRTLDSAAGSFDRVLLRNTVFCGGFMRDPVDASGTKLRTLFGPSVTAFGQPGAGGSHAFADPENGISFAYVMNQMEPGVMPNQKALGLVEALYR